MSRKRGDVHRFSCGDIVHDKADPRHEARVEAIVGMTAIIKFTETGWRSEVPVSKLERSE